MWVLWRFCSEYRGSCTPGFLEPPGNSQQDLGPEMICVMSAPGTRISQSFVPTLCPSPAPALTQVTSLPAPFTCLCQVPHSLPFHPRGSPVPAKRSIPFKYQPRSSGTSCNSPSFPPSTCYILTPTPHTLLLPRSALLLPMCSSSPCFLSAVHSISSLTFSQHLLQASSLDYDKRHCLSLFKTLFFPPNN